MKKGKIVGNVNCMLSLSNRGYAKAYTASNKNNISNNKYNK